MPDNTLQDWWPYILFTFYSHCLYASSQKLAIHNDILMRKFCCIILRSITVYMIDRIKSSWKVNKVHRTNELLSRKWVTWWVVYIKAAIVELVSLLDLWMKFQYCQSARILFRQLRIHLICHGFNRNVTARICSVRVWELLNALVVIVYRVTCPWSVTAIQQQNRIFATIRWMPANNENAF